MKKYGCNQCWYKDSCRRKYGQRPCEGDCKEYKNNIEKETR